MEKNKILTIGFILLSFCLVGVFLMIALGKKQAEFFLQEEPQIQDLTLSFNPNRTEFFSGHPDKIQLTIKGHEGNKISAFDLTIAAEGEIDIIEVSEPKTNLAESVFKKIDFSQKNSLKRIRLVYLSEEVLPERLPDSISFELAVINKNGGLAGLKIDNKLSQPEFVGPKKGQAEETAYTVALNDSLYNFIKPSLSNLSERPFRGDRESAVFYVANSGNDDSNNCLNSAAPCQTVQHAVNQTSPGDEVRVAAGTYNTLNDLDNSCQLVYLDKNIVLAGGYSTSNWATPDYKNNETVLTASFENGCRILKVRNASPVIQGFKITQGNCVGTYCGYGGGVYLETSNAQLINNVIINNKACSHGGGLSSWQGSPLLKNNVIIDNQLTCTYGSTGTGAYIYGGTAQFLYTTLRNNTGGNDAGIQMEGESGDYLAVENSIICDHTTGVDAQNTEALVSIDGILWYGNDSNHFGNVFVTHEQTANPRFSSDGYHLTQGSPAVNVINWSSTACSFDLDNDSRPSPEGGKNDLGADEFYFSNNHPPNMPSNPTPSDGSNNISLYQILSWQCSDPDSDPLTYDVYFGTASMPPKAVSDLTEASYDPDLEENTTYYWRIVAKDSEDSTASFIWNFTTGSGGTPPTSPSPSPSPSLPPPSPSSKPPAPACTDSDGGINLQVPGSCNSHDNNGRGIFIFDSCYNGFTIKEAYCDNNTCLSSNYACPEGTCCGKDGAFGSASCQTKYCPSSPIRY